MNTTQAERVYRPAKLGTGCFIRMVKDIEGGGGPSRVMRVLMTGEIFGPWESPVRSCHIQDGAA